MHGNTINEPNSSNSSFVGKLFIDITKKKKKRQHLIKVLPVWVEMIYVGSFWWCCCDLRSRRSIYHGNILIKEQCRLPVLACWINICAQMYSAASMYMLSSQFSFHLNGRRLSYRHMWHVWDWFTYSPPSSLFPPLLLSFIPWFFWGVFSPLCIFSAVMQTWCD